MSIYHDLQGMKDLALVDALQFGENVNVIISNPDEDGKFSFTQGSTYEKVADSYFNKPRTAIIIYKTDDEPNIELARALVKEDNKRYISMGRYPNYCISLVSEGLTMEVLKAEAERLGYVIPGTEPKTCTLTFGTPWIVKVQEKPAVDSDYVIPNPRDLNKKFYDKFYRKRF